MSTKILQLIKDYRTGNKLEIIIPVYNEEARIDNILSYYGKDFDVVIFDGGSTDRTVAKAVQAQATVFQRLDKQVTEKHFAYYVNNETKSKCCFYIFIDEYIDRVHLFDAYDKIKIEAYVILGRRYDWLYGKRMPFDMGITPRGLYKGCARYNPHNLHKGLEYIHSSVDSKKEVVYDIEHFHIWDCKKYFGTAGNYAYIEVKQYLGENNSRWLFTKRFLMPLLSYPLRRFWRIKNPVLAVSIYCINLAVFFIALYALFEQKYLMSPEKQWSLYEKKYK